MLHVAASVGGRSMSPPVRPGAGSVSGPYAGVVRASSGNDVERPTAVVRDVTDGMSDRSLRRPTLVG
ncbi:hypothetical protein ASD16_16105 [Cellulomonas sp. Root485]|nr:hypothetical protein ASD16_16105 [Cellulomonas sp. Root485]